jgi:methylenetetrahydrofolate reductase (NADPH)
VTEQFDVICEIEPPTKPDLRHVQHQIDVLSPLARSFLIPDNHIGRATVSSIAVAHEVAKMGSKSIVCLNARDRNLLGLHRDMLTAAVYGVDKFLFVYGDKPAIGNRTGELTVRTMLEEARMLAGGVVFPNSGSPQVGVAASLRPFPEWKQSADFVFAQICYSIDAFLRWRDSVKVAIPVYAGVMVLSSPNMARRLAAQIPEIEVPAPLIERLSLDSRAGVEAACEQVEALRDSGAVNGVHLVPVNRYREVALRLKGRL